MVAKSYTDLDGWNTGPCSMFQRSIENVQKEKKAKMYTLAIPTDNYFFSPELAI